MSDLNARGVRFVAKDIGIDTETPAGQFAMTVMSAVAELEREQIRDRQRAGIARAKKRGKYKGRKPVFGKHYEPVRQLLAAGKGVSYIAETLRISRTTVYKIKRLIEIDGQMELDVGGVEVGDGAL
jgi:DNA invertase Pin-like site-specific DNA recombinase